MLDLNADRPVIWWTLDDFNVLKANRQDYGFGESTIKQDVIPTPVVIDENEIKFDTPESWGSPTTTITFKRNPNGSYTGHGQESDYRVVRAETDGPIWLIGNSNEPVGKGVIIVCLPKMPK